MYYFLGVCILLFSVYMFGSSARLFFKLHRADSEAGWRAAGLAAAESPINTLLCALLVFMFGNYTPLGVFSLLAPVALLLFSCGKLIQKATKLEQMTMYLRLSIARVASAALSLTLLFFAAYTDLLDGSLGAYSVMVAMVTVLLTVVTMYQSWRMKHGKNLRSKDYVGRVL